MCEVLVYLGSRRLSGFVYFERHDLVWLAPVNYQADRLGADQSAVRLTLWD